MADRDDTDRVAGTEDANDTGDVDTTGDVGASEAGDDHASRRDADQRAHLDRAREALQRADEHASGSVHEQLESLAAGIFEEEEGVHTQEEPGPKVDRITEVAQKLDALAEKANERETAEGMLDARDHLRRYLKDHPQGG